MRILSPKIAPPEKGLEGSTDKTATVRSFFLNFEINLSINVLFPAPGGPVTPILYA